MAKRNSIAIIPARGGSKRIPRKNIKSFLGKPIIAYSIEAALKSNLFDEVMVSTDDSEIELVAKQHGAKVPFLRSEANSSDLATTFSVVEEVIQEYQSGGKEFIYCCCIYPAAPFITSEKLNLALKQLIDNDFDTVLPVMRFSSPIQRALRLRLDNKVEMFSPEHINTRSQDLQPAFHDAGQFYWFNVLAVLKQQSILTNNAGIIEIMESEGQDIDNFEDWKLAELKYKILQEKLHLL